jgi:hypothetical protein
MDVGCPNEIFDHKEANYRVNETRCIANVTQPCIKHNQVTGLEIGTPPSWHEGRSGRETMSERWQKVPGLITRLYEITDELETMFGRKFTPDGH